MRKKWAAFIGVFVVLIAVVVGANLVTRSSLNSDVDSQLQQTARELGQAINVNESGVTLPKSPGDLTEAGAQSWVFVAGQTLSGPAGIDPQIAAAAKSLDGQPSEFVDVPGHEVRLLSVPLFFQDQRIGTLVAGLSTASSHRAQRVTLITTGAFLAAVLMVAGLVAVLLRVVRKRRGSSAATT